MRIFKACSDMVLKNMIYFILYNDVKYNMLHISYNIKRCENVEVLCCMQSSFTWKTWWLFAADNSTIHVYILIKPLISFYDWCLDNHCSHLNVVILWIFVDNRLQDINSSKAAVKFFFCENWIFKQMINSRWKIDDIDI